jgi:hypothetical protein
MTGRFRITLSRQILIAGPRISATLLEHFLRVIFRNVLDDSRGYIGNRLCKINIARYGIGLIISGDFIRSSNCSNMAKLPSTVLSSCSCISGAQLLMRLSSVPATALSAMAIS